MTDSVNVDMYIYASSITALKHWGAHIERQTYDTYMHT